VEKIQDKIGELQQKIAEECCTENLQKEVEATMASGTLHWMMDMSPLLVAVILVGKEEAHV